MTPNPERRDVDARVVLVDENDAEVGIAEKLQAHRSGLLHRAVSVFVFRADGDMLLQRRAEGKYHSGGLWSNACCTHPSPGETPHEAGTRRLIEEMGIDCALEHAFSFIYEAEFPNGLHEREYDHVFIGRFDGEPACNSAEVSEWKWSDAQALRLDLRDRPEDYTVWFRLAVSEMHARKLALLAGD